MRKSSRHILLLLGLFLFCNSSLAACSFVWLTGGVGNGIIALPANISTAEDLPIGSVLWSNNRWEWFTTGQVNCNTTETIRGQLPGGLGQVTSDPRVRATNVPGIGVAIYWCNKNASNCVSDPFKNGSLGAGINGGWSEIANLNWTVGSGNYNTYTHWWVYLVKTGKISSGRVTIDGIAKANYGALTTGQLTLTGSTEITNRSCVQTSPSAINLELPVITKKEFGAIGTPIVQGKDRQFNIVLNCDPSLKVNLNIASNGGSTTNVLTNMTGATMATGVGIQLFKGDSSSNTIMPLDAKTQMAITSSTDRDQSVNIPLTARYYKTGTIGAGIINISTTYTLTYE